jgi:hypothetical protein
VNLELAADRELALTVACLAAAPRGCGAPIGEPCRNLSTGQPVEHIAAHDARLRAAGVLHAPLDSRELAAPHERTPR